MAEGIETAAIESTVVAVITHADGTKTIEKSKNKLTDAGALWYAQHAVKDILASGSITNAFTTLFLGHTTTPSPAVGDDLADIDQSSMTANTKAVTSGYPKLNDDDVDNTGKGAGIISWKFEFGKTDAVYNGITEGGIAVSGATSTAPILNRFAFSPSINKTANDTLKVFVNHTFVSGT